MPNSAKPVAVIMGSQSDWDTMRHAAQTLETLGVGYQTRIVSAHRTPDRLVAFAKSAASEGFEVIIAGAGGAAHLPGMTAAMTPLPVLGVPMESAALSGMDLLLSIVQMPGGVPVGTLAIGKPGAINAALLAAAILARGDSGSFPASCGIPLKADRERRAGAQRRRLDECWLQARRSVFWGEDNWRECWRWLARG